MFEIEIEIVVAKGFGKFHRESILKDLKTSSSDVQDITCEVVVSEAKWGTNTDTVRVLLCGDAIPGKKIKDFVDWICQYHEGTVIHSKNYKGGNQNGNQ